MVLENFKNLISEQNKLFFIDLYNKELKQLQKNDDYTNYEVINHNQDLLEIFIPIIQDIMTMSNDMECDNTMTQQLLEDELLPLIKTLVKLTESDYETFWTKYIFI